MKDQINKGSSNPDHSPTDGVEELRIVFMGTPEFAVASLHALVNAGFHIAGVVTAPDNPAGRGMKLQESAVKKFAVEKRLKILQPGKLKNAQFLEELQSLHADLFVVVAFRMLPEAVWSMPPMGTINLHASLLPQYRGAAPLNWAIINGEKETGVTTFKLKHEIDTGNILLQQKIAITENETAGELHDKLKELGAQLLIKTIHGLADGQLKETPQPVMENGKWKMEDYQSSSAASSYGIHHLQLKHAPKIFTENCKIDWNKSIDEVHNLIRGLSPFPGAFTYLNSKLLKIYSSCKEFKQPSIPQGQFETDGKTFLKFACKDGFIVVKEMQREGKKKMSVEDFLLGYKFTA